MGKTNNKFDFPLSFNSNGEWITDKKKNAIPMNKFYSNIGIETNQSVGTSNPVPNIFSINSNPSKWKVWMPLTFLRKMFLKLANN